MAIPEVNVQNYVRARESPRPLVCEAGLLLIGLVPLLELWHRVCDLIAVSASDGQRLEPEEPIAVPEEPIAVPVNFLVRDALQVFIDELHRPEGATIPLLQSSKNLGKVLPSGFEGEVQEVEGKPANLGVVDDAILTRSPIATRSSNGVALEGLEDLLNTSRHSFRGSFVHSALELACLDAVLVEVLENLVGVPITSMRTQSSLRQENDLLKKLAPLSRVVAISIHDCIMHHAADIVREHCGERGH
jgi:hypothetical protein